MGWRGGGGGGVDHDGARAVHTPDTLDRHAGSYLFQSEVGTSR